MSGWITSFPCNRAEAEALTGEHPALSGFDPAPVLVASEEDEDSDRWRIDLYTDAKPPRVLVQMVGRALGIAPRRLPSPAALPDTDWVTLSQTGLEPVRAGRFYVHTGSDAPDKTPGTINFRIEASQAFGTGHHDTTAGCLSAIDALGARGRRFDHIADIGTGTGLLAFAAMRLWPRAYAIASDIDPASVAVSAENAEANAVPLGRGRGQLALVVADGVAHPAIAERAPYDLLLVNILAGPLITLAPALAQIATPGAVLLLAGLLGKQRSAVVAAYQRHGWRLDDDGGDVAWPTLRLSRRRSWGWQRPVRSDGRGGLPPGDYGAW